MNTTGESSAIGISYDTNPITKSGQQTRTTSTVTGLPQHKSPPRHVLRTTPQAQPQTYSRTKPAATYLNPSSTHLNSPPFSVAASGSGRSLAAGAEPIKQSKMSYSAIILVFVFTTLVYYLLSTQKADELLGRVVSEPTGVVGTLIRAVVLGVVVIISIKIGGA